MTLRNLPMFLGGAAAGILVLLITSAGPPSPASPAVLRTVIQDPQAEMEAMMKRMAQFTAPGENHKHLERFLGNWKTETSFLMGGQKSPAEEGVASVEWLIQGRWLQSRGQGRMMGMDAETVMILGYDNFKMSYVGTVCNSLDTALNRFEGDLIQDGSALIAYGTLDEYLTGEHDKMVKYIWRFVSDDEIILEVHDLPIGETDTQVVEVKYTRK